MATTYVEQILALDSTIVNGERLTEIIQRPFVVYDGFEPSNTPHVIQVLGLAQKIRTFIQHPNCTFVVYVADVFAELNLKLGGDKAQIRAAGERMIKIWQACGISSPQVKFVWASELIAQPGYWELVMRLSQHFTSKRLQRCCTALGKSEKDVLKGSQILYPLMQCVDAFMLKADIIAMGLDQTKVSMLVVEAAEHLKLPKPVLVSHPMLLGLNGTKMSKSHPDHAIFLTDAPEVIQRKILKALCPPTATGNPILDIIKHVLWPWCRTLTITQDEDTRTYTEWSSLLSDYEAGRIIPLALKKAVIAALQDIFEPFRKLL